MYRFRFNAVVLSWLNDYVFYGVKVLILIYSKLKPKIPCIPLINSQPIFTLRPILPRCCYPMINQSFGVRANAAGQVQGYSHYQNRSFV